jgi:hypothetical protein
MCFVWLNVTGSYLSARLSSLRTAGAFSAFPVQMDAIKRVQKLIKKTKVTVLFIYLPSIFQQFLVKDVGGLRFHSPGIVDFLHFSDI